MKKYKALLSLLLIAVILCTSLIMSSAATPVTEDESRAPNEIPTQATAFDLESYATGKLNTSSDIDWYSVKTTVEGVASLKFTHTGGGSDKDAFKVTVYSTTSQSEKDIETTFTVKGSDTSVSSPKFDAAVGTHYIKIQSSTEYKDTTYSIQLDISTYSSHDEEESNNSVSEANAITNTAGSYSKWIYGQISSSSDVDYYSFSTVTGFFTIEIKYSDGTKGTYTVNAYSAVNTMGVTSEKNIGEITLSPTASSAETGEIGVSKGTYYFKVSGSVGGYFVRVYTASDLNTETEYNDGKTYADVLTNGTTTYACLSSENDVDYFRITSDGSANSKVEIYAGTKASTTGASWQVILYNSDCSQVLRTFTASASTSAVVPLSEFNSGEYIIAVSKGSVYTSANYLIKNSAGTISDKTDTDDDTTDTDDVSSILSGLLSSIKGGNTDWMTIISKLAEVFTTLMTTFLTKLPSLVSNL